MKTLIGAAAIAGALVFAGPAAVNSAAAASPQMKGQTAGTSGATDFSAQPYYRRYGYGYYRPYYRPYYRSYYRPYPYYARPRYYRPYPYYAPAPFAFGFGFGPYW
ncbi:hypothetical protein LJR220_002325 [Bradyrhizobium sp. LjRoot220]|uniref:hypothetical protein n=1 Tax=Bradyrhizobium sp. LjRoot220 TaxID=3342284 RepID=UPI003ECE3DCC